MKQKGEVSFLTIVLTLGLSSLLILHSVQLRYHYSLIRKRTSLFLCAKDMKSTLLGYSHKIIKTNWGIKNVDNIKVLSLFVPGLQGAALNAEKVKTILNSYQDLELQSLRLNLLKLRDKGCNFNFATFEGPFKTNSLIHLRRRDGITIPKGKIWQVPLKHSPFKLLLDFHFGDIASLNPKISVTSKENLENFLYKWQSFSSL